MRISKREFDRRLKAGKLVITFIGMSGIGKTYNAKKLKKAGFKHVSCDDMIAQRVKGKHLKNVTDVGLWMGQPYSRGYKLRERTYLKLENDVTRDSLKEIAHNTVIDSTGSIVYLRNALQKKVKENALVVYFRAEKDIYDRMLTLYLADPKPVVWGSLFKQKKGENRHHALARSFSKLLDYRARRYAELADVTLPAKKVWDLGGNTNRLLKLARAQLP